jgi:hypothetical protein
MTREAAALRGVFQSVQSLSSCGMIGKTRKCHVVVRDVSFANKPIPPPPCDVPQLLAVSARTLSFVTLPRSVGCV